MKQWHNPNLKIGSYVKLRDDFDYQEYGVSPRNTAEAKFMTGVMEVEDVHPMPLDEEPDHRAVFIKKLPFVFGEENFDVIA